METTKRIIAPAMGLIKIARQEIILAQRINSTTLLCTKKIIKIY